MSFSDVLKGKFEVTLPPDEIAEKLNSIRKTISKTYFEKLRAGQQAHFLDFLFAKLDKIWQLHQKLHPLISETVGCVLMSLGPFHGPMLMDELKKVFQEKKPVSVLLFACFCFLANFLFDEDIKPIAELLKQTPLADPDSREMVKLVKRQLPIIPPDYLPVMAKTLLNMYFGDPKMELCLKVVRAIVSSSPDVYIKTLDVTLPLSVLGVVFTKGMPTMPKETAARLTERCVNEVKNMKSDPKEFAGACAVLRALILTKQAPFSCVQGIYDDKTLNSAPDPKAILLVPIELDIVMKIYGSRKWEEHKIEMESQGFMMDYMRVSGDDEAALTSQFDSNILHSVCLPRTDMVISTGFSLPLPDDVESNHQDDGASSNQLETPKKFEPSKFDDDMTLDFGTPVASKSPDAKEEAPNSGPLPPLPEKKRITIPPALDAAALHTLGIPAPRGSLMSPRARSSSVRDPESPSSIDPAMLHNLGIPSPKAPLLSPRARAASVRDPDSPAPPQIPLPLSKDSSMSIPGFNIGPPPPKPPTNKRPPSGLLNDYAEYMSSAAAIDYRLLDNSFLVALMKYFCFFPDYEHELGSLILHGITTNDDLFDDAIKVTAEAMSNFGNDTLNCILFYAFKSSNPAPARRIRLLKLIKSISFNQLIKTVGDKIMTFLDNSLGQKLAKIHKLTRDAAVGLYQNTSARIFKFAFDAMVVKLDVFDEFMFEQRLAFLAGVLKRVTPTFALYFRHLHTLLAEILSLTPFSKRALADMFRIESLLAKTCDVSELTLFIQYAVNVLEMSYRIYTGSSWGLKLPSAFALQLPKYEFQTGTYTDLISCPRNWHSKIVPCGEAAYQFLTAIPWADLHLKNAEACWLVSLAMKCVQIFPAESNTLVQTMLEAYPSFVKSECVKYLGMAVKYSFTQEAMVSLCGLWMAAAKQGISSKVDITKSRKQIIATCPQYRNLHYKQVALLGDCLVKMNVKAPSDIWVKLVCESEKQNWLDQEPPDELELSLNVGIPPPRPDDAKDESEEEPNEEEDAADVTGLHDNDPLDEASLEGFAKYLTSVTPLLYSNVDVPARLLPSVVIIAYAQYSKAMISERQCMDLFNLALEFSSSRTVFYVLRYAEQAKIKIDLRPYLGHRNIRCKQMFPMVLGIITQGKKCLDDLSEEEMNYIKFFSSDDLFDFVLNATGPQRKTGAFLVKFDPEFFLCRYKMVNDLNLQQLTTLGGYLSCIPSSSNDGALALLTGLLNTTSETLQIKLIKRRLLTMYLVSHNVPTAYIKQNFASMFLFHLDRDGNLPIKEISLLPCVEIVEIHYAIAVLGYKHSDFSRLLGQLVPLLGKMSTYGSYELLLSGQATEEEMLWLLKLEQLPSIDLHVMDAVTRQMKAKAQYIPPVSVLTALLTKNWVWTAPLREQSYGFIFIASTKDISSELKKTLFKVATTVAFSESGQWGRLCVLMKRFQSMFTNKSEEVRQMLSFCGDTIASGCYPRTLIEIFTVMSQRTRNWQKLKEVFSEALLKTRGPNAVMMADSVTLCNFTSGGDQSEAAALIPQCAYFFAMFNALVTVEKKNRQMVHTKFMEQFTGCHRRSLEYLTNPKMRIFAPWLAYAPDALDVPEDVDVFLDFIADKIERVHEVDTCHEW